MDFTVKFTTGNKDLPLVEKVGTPGLDILDLIRETYPVAKNMSSHRIYFNDSCPIDGSAMLIEVTEEQARQSGRFKGKTKVEVLVPGSSFSRFIDLSLKEEYYAEEEERWLLPTLAKIPFLRWLIPIRTITTRVLQGVKVDYVYTKGDVLNKWIADGHPLEWHP
jgi:hypothetical protein